MPGNTLGSRIVPTTQALCSVVAGIPALARRTDCLELAADLFQTPKRAPSSMPLICPAAGLASECFWWRRQARAGGRC